MNICTIVTKPYLAYARVLARSVSAVHPSAQVYVLLADRVDGCFDPSTEPFQTVLLEDLGYPEMVGPMSFYYTAFELCCALRGLFHEYMWMKSSAEAWFFLDSDVYVMGSMADAIDTLMSASMLLNPHNVAPARVEFLDVSEFPTLRNGLFNGGFVGVHRCEQSKQFIAWFKDRLFSFCLEGVGGLFVDQLWLNLVPHYFRDVALYTHPGANLGHWNLYQRTITRDAQGGYSVDGKPLMFVHFSGWNIDDPGDVSKYSPAYRSVSIPQMKDWKELGEQYRTALLENGYLSASRWPYAFDRFDNGAAIMPAMRRQFYDEFWSGVPQTVSPFARGREFCSRGAAQ